jgi:hypothetical protein
MVLIHLFKNIFSGILIIFVSEMSKNLNFKFLKDPNLSEMG